MRNNIPLKRGFKRLSGLYAALWIRELENSWFRFFDVTNRLKSFSKEYFYFFAPGGRVCFQLILIIHLWKDAFRFKFNQMYLCYLFGLFSKKPWKKNLMHSTFLLFSSYSTWNVPGFPFPVDANNEIDFREEPPELFRLAGACKLVGDHSYIT